MSRVSRKLVVLALAAAAALAFADASQAADFRVTVDQGSARSSTRVVTVSATNVAKWTATTVRICAVVSGAGARITGVEAPGSLKSATSACAIVARVPAKATRTLRLRVRSSQGRRARVQASATAVNSNRRQRSLTLARASQATSQIPCGNKIGVVFVADDSGSMLGNDPSKLRGQGISLGLDQLPDGSLAAATKFSNGSSPLFAVSEVNQTTVPTLKTGIARLVSSGGTDYEAAFVGAQAQLAAMGAADRKAVIFLSDGQPNTTNFTSDQPIAAQGIPIFTIGFGTADNAVLAGIAGRSGGQTFSARSADDLQSIFARVIAILACNSASVRTELDVAPGTTQTVPFAVGVDDGEFRALATWSGGHLTVTAERPDATVMTPTALRPGERFSDNPTYALLTGSDPVVGGWQLKIASDVGNASSVHVNIDVFKKELAALPAATALKVSRQGRQLDPCASLYGGGKTKRSGGRQTYDRTASLYQLCGGFGTPVDFAGSLAARCAFASAATVIAGGPASATQQQRFEQICGTANVVAALTGGKWASSAKGKGCAVFNRLFATAAAAFAAGEAGTGAATAGTRIHRGFEAGFQLACGSAFISGGKVTGPKLAADREAELAQDVLGKGLCLRSTERSGRATWSTTTCA